MPKIMFFFFGGGSLGCTLTVSMNKNIINEYIIFGTREDFLPFVFCLINFESPKKHNETNAHANDCRKTSKKSGEIYGKKIN